MTETFEQWLAREYRYAATAMLRSVSAVDIVQTRPGFGQTMHPVRGSIIASPIPGAYDPDPDYFFHWYRDSAVVINALRLLYEDGSVGSEALAQVADFVRFSLSLQALDGRDLTADLSRRTRVSPDFLKFLRNEHDLAAAHGDAIAAETRVNPDGSLDISKWPRPQHDGPPLTALTLLRWAHSTSFDAEIEADLSALIRAHLSFTCRHWQEPSYDIWEEEKGQHYYTLRISAAALTEGADWLERQSLSEPATRYRAEAARILRRLDDFWLADAGHYRSRVLESGKRSGKELDIAVILAAVHAQSGDDSHSVNDPRMQATLKQLDALFDASYPINRQRGTQSGARRGPAMGRYAGDVYYSGGAYYFSSLGAAEFCFHASAAAENRRDWFERGDAYLATVRVYTPSSGELSEQFDQRSGVQTSAPHLAWSYAAFISCLTARRSCITHAAQPVCNNDV